MLLAFSTIAGFDVRMTSADSTYYPPPGSWNGRKVYLSPALHSPENIGCDGYQESTGARRAALNVRDYLLARGYAVRVGSNDYVTNVESSNAWGSTVHIPIHSNAGANDCYSPFIYGNGGTWLMYEPGSTSGSNLAQKIFDAVRSSSPGTWDLKDTDTNLAGFALYELRNTTMPAAYVESAFHTFRPDVDWLRVSATVASKIGAGIDNYFGNPRCPCPTLAPPEVSSPTTASTDDSTAPHPGATVDANGTPATVGGTVATIRLSADAVAIVDFAVHPALATATTTNGARTLIAGLNQEAFADPTVLAVEYRLDGSCSSFWASLQAPCQRIER